MEYSLSISFKDFSFRDKMIAFILTNFKLKSIEFRENFELHKISKNEVYSVDSDEIHFNLKSEKEDCIILQNMNNSLPRIYGGEIYFDTVCLLRKFVEFKFIDLFIEGQIHNYIDKSLQNTDEVKYYSVYDKEIPPYVEIIPNPNYVEGAPGMDMIEKEYINLESLPGHSHTMQLGEQLWFGSSWQMYFSPVYYKYIPKFLFDEFTDCYENKVFENGLRRITLFENPEDYDLPENRARQWAFRRALGIDSIAHEVCTRLTRQQFEPKDLPVKITKKNCVKGTTRVEIIKENKIIIKEFLDDGITLIFEEKIIL